MDPNQVLNDLRNMTMETPMSISEADDLCDRFRDAFRALDAWLSNGGFKPADWMQA